MCSIPRADHGRDFSSAQRDQSSAADLAPDADSRLMLVANLFPNGG
jgi:hypothetical protein